MYYNPIDEMISFWYDQCIKFFLKMYYWPNFIIGTADDFAAVFNPKTYSICKI